MKSKEEYLLHVHSLPQLTQFREFADNSYLVYFVTAITTLPTVTSLNKQQLQLQLQGKVYIMLLPCQQRQLYLTHVPPTRLSSL